MRLAGSACVVNVPNVPAGPRTVSAAARASVSSPVIVR